MSRERILVVTTSFPARAGDPAGHFVAAEATRLARDGHDVRVIAPGCDRVIEGVSVYGIPDRGAFGWPGALARLRARPQRALGALGFAREARRRLRAERHDRVVAHWLVPTAWPIAVASSAALEVVAHGSDVRLFTRLPGSLRRRIAGELVERGARLRCVSHELAQALVAADARFAERLHVEPAAVDVSAAPTREAARRALGVDAGARLLVVAGRLVRDKRVEVALGAAELVPGAAVVVVGDGPEAPALRERFPGARFVGLVPRELALTWIAAADLVLTASRVEGAPSVVREARALGVPVVSARAADLERWAASDAGLWLVG